jgi:hypothetical protein
MDEALEDGIWQEMFVEFQLRIGIDERGFERLMRALEPDVCPTRQFSYFRFGRITDSLTVDQVMAIVGKLSLRSDGGLRQALDVLGMVVSCSKEKDNNYRVGLGVSIREFLLHISWPKLSEDAGGGLSHNIGQIMDLVVWTAESGVELDEILDHILLVGDDDYISYDDIRKKALIPIFRKFPKYALDKVCVSDADGKFIKIRVVTGDLSFGWHEDRPLSQIPKDVFIDWCNEDPALRYPFVAEVCELFEKTKPNEEPNILSEVALALIHLAPDSTVVLDKIVGRFAPSSWSGSYSSVLASRLPMFDQMITGDNKAVHVAVGVKKAKFEEVIASYRDHEQKTERERDSSFE